MLPFVSCEAPPSHSHSWGYLGGSSPLEGIDSQKLCLSSALEHLLIAIMGKDNVLTTLFPLYGLEIGRTGD